jgi:hypothetical protein
MTSTLNAIVAQRLARQLCTQCREAFALPPELLEQLPARRACRSAPGRLRRVSILVISHASAPPRCLTRTPGRQICSTEAIELQRTAVAGGVPEVSGFGK